jgi:hypothetical protein
MLKSITTRKTSKSSVGLLVLTLILGGISAQASGFLNSPSGGYLVCVNSKTKVVTHPGTSNCPKGSKKLVLGAQGATGVSGANGRTLLNGIKDPDSTVGAQGDMFINTTTNVLFGPKNIDGTWPAGVSIVGPRGPGGSGPAGPQGPAGATGSSGIAITQLSICGASGTSLCKVGVQGPGGGTIFFVDYNDIYPTFNYLEAAPTSCESASKTWSSANIAVTAALGWAGRAVGAGSANTAAIKAVFTDNTSTNNAAYFATSCLAGGQSDWFLGSLGEMKLMYDNLQGVGGFVEDDDWSSSDYWSSTDYNAGNAWYVTFYAGYQSNYNKSNRHRVRPVRAF